MKSGSHSTLSFVQSCDVRPWFMFSVAFCYSNRGRAVKQDTPGSQCKESMAEGVWSPKKDQVFVSTMLFVIAPDSGLGGTGFVWLSDCAWARGV